MDRILLIYPPWSRNSEPPLGLGLIQAALRAEFAKKRNGSISRILDLNAAAARDISRTAQEDGSTRTHRAILHRDETLRLLASAEGYNDTGTYRQTMSYYADLLRAVSRSHPWKLTPSDFLDPRFSGFGPTTVTALLKERQPHPILACTLHRLHTDLAEFRPTVIGISLTFRSQFIPGLLLASYMRRNYPDIRLCIGGAFVRGLPKKSRYALNQEDIVTTTENGETFFLKMIDNTVNTPESPPFRSPDFTGIDRSMYFAPVPVEPMISSRGCYWGRCAFCDECREPFSADDPDNLIQRFNDGIQTGNPHVIHWTDHAIPPAALTALIKHSNPRPWYGFVRPVPQLTDPEFVDRLAQSGCRMLQIGFETPVQSLLNAMRKGVDASDFGPIIVNLQRSGIRCYAYMLFGYPGQSLADADQAVAFLKSSPPDFLNASLFRMPPGAPISQTADPSGQNPDNARRSDRLYLDVPDSGVSRREWRHWMADRLHSASGLGFLTQKTPHYYKSSHAVFLDC